MHLIADKTTTNETTTTTTTENTTINILPPPNCKTEITSRKVEEGFWTNTITTTYTDRCTGKENVIVSPELTGTTLSLILLLGLAIIALVVLKGRRFDGK